MISDGTTPRPTATAVPGARPLPTGRSFDVASNARGDIGVIWERAVPGSGITTESVLRPSGGRWSEVRAVSKSDDGTRRFSTRVPRITFHPSGLAAATWTDVVPAPPGQFGPRLNRGASKLPPAAGAWTPYEVASETADQFPGTGGSAPQYSLAGLTTSWIDTARGGNVAPALFLGRQGSDGSWQAVGPLDVAAPVANNHGVVDVASNGLAVAAWRSFRGQGQPIGIDARVLDSRTGALGPETPLANQSGGGVLGLPAAARSPQGDAIVAWHETRSRASLRASVYSAAAGAFSPVESFESTSARFPIALASPRGELALVWDRIRGEEVQLRAAVRDVNGKWTNEAVAVERGRIGVEIVAAFSADGRLWIAWTFCRTPTGGCRVRLASRTAGPPIRLSARQLLVNQRVSQAAIRRAAQIEEVLTTGIGTDLLQSGSLTPADFSATVTTSGSPNGAFPPPVARPQADPGPPSKPTPTRLPVSVRQLLINQRVAQAAVRRANALEARLRRGLTGGDIIDGAITANRLAPGVSIAASSPSGQPAPSRTILAPRSGGNPGKVALTVRQVEINQRVSQAAVLRVNRLRAQLDAGLTGADLRAGSLTQADLEPALR